MSLRLFRTRLPFLAIAAAIAFTSVGCEEDEKDETEEEDDGESKKKKKKKKKKGKKGKKKDDGDDDKATEEATSPPKKIDVEPPTFDDDTKKLAKSLESKVRRGRFSYDLTKDKANAKVWVFHAATATDRELVMAGLRAMESAYTSYDKSKTNVLADEDYAKAVLLKIQDPDGAIQELAIKAARHSVGGKTPNMKVVDAIVDLAANHPKPEGRYEAVDTLASLSKLTENPVWLAPMLKALDAKEPFLVSEALKNLRYKSFDDSARADMKDRYVKLLKHSDPGVRGLAADGIGHLGAWKKGLREEYAKEVIPLLQDPDPYAKSEAIGALGALRHKKSAHELIKMIDDETKNQYNIRGWTRLNGEPGNQYHDGASWSHVGGAALEALRDISRDTKKKFEYKIKFKTKDADLKAARAKAKAWYESVKGDL